MTQQQVSEAIFKAQRCFRTIVLPKLERCGLLHPRVSHPSEMAATQYERQLDTCAGIDWFLAFKYSERPLPAAVRLLYMDEGREHSMSLRFSLPSGAPTEYDKISEALRTGGVAPQWHVYAFLEKLGPFATMEPRLWEVIMVRTRELFEFVGLLREAVLDNRFRKRFTVVKARADSVEWVFVPKQAAAEAGMDLIILKGDAECRFTPPLLAREAATK